MKIKGKIKAVQIGTDLKPELIIGTNRIGENIEKLKDKEWEIEFINIEKEKNNGCTLDW